MSGRWPGALARTGLAASLLLGACVPLPQSMVRQDPRIDWNHTLDGARQAVIAGRYADADSLLAAYTKRHPDASQAAEALYWQGLFRLDPGNPNRSIDAGIGALDQYLAGPPTRAHWREATTVRRLAQQLDTATKLAAATATTQVADDHASPSGAGSDDAKSKDDEITRLRNELAKANEELDRIKKRLSAPRP